MQGISQRALAELAGMNRAFITLAAMGDADGNGAGRFGLEANLIARLRLLDGEARRRLADKPYALFGLSFHEGSRWHALLDRGVRDVTGAPSWPDDVSRPSQFLVMALGAMREVAGREPVSASVLFGMPPPLAAHLARAEIGTLPFLAQAVTPWLRARCASRTGWWSGMIVTACGDGARLVDPHRGIHASLMRALDLGGGQLPAGRLCRRL